MTGWKWRSGAVVAALLLATTNAMAGSASTSMAVSATVAGNCTISATALNFGSYDPVVANATAPLEGTGSLVITCTKGATATVGLSAGQNGSQASGTTRAMTSGGSYLSYELYQDSGRAAVWGNASGSLLAPAAAPSKDPRTFVVYGRIPAAQDAPAGSYTDTVIATVNF
jgi:spore coat protein U-like protein